MEYLSVKNHERFQHYKHRNPPWIKLYTELLDDYEFGCLQDASKLLAICLWLLAAKHQNRIPHDVGWIQKRSFITSPIELQPLLDTGFIFVCKQDASNALADCKQSALSETETEREKEQDQIQDQKLLSTSRQNGALALRANGAVRQNGQHSSTAKRSRHPQGVVDVVVRERIANAFANIAETTRTKAALRAAQVDIAFSYWVAVHKKDPLRTILDRKRELRILARLDESDGDLSTILYAIQGAKVDRALVEGGYDGIETILRDRGNVERLAQHMPKYRAGKMHDMARKLLGDAATLTLDTEANNGEVG